MQERERLHACLPAARPSYVRRTSAVDPPERWKKTKKKCVAKTPYCALSAGAAFAPAQDPRESLQVALTQADGRDRAQLQTDATTATELLLNVDERKTAREAAFLAPHFCTGPGGSAKTEFCHGINPLLANTTTRR